MTTTQPNTGTTEYLICDARHPLVSGVKLLDEFILYNLDKAARQEVCAQYKSFTGNTIGTDSRTEVLSGGQKVLLMLLLAMYSPAPKLCFIGLERGLDMEIRLKVRSLLDSQAQKKVLFLEEEK